MPLVSGIKLGDVLLGTKNLRRWLQAAALNVHLNAPPNPRQVAKTVYQPNRQDRFIVAANNDRVLAVWGDRQNIIIPFINPGIEAAHSPPPRMDGRLFSQWFTHTEERMPDLREWPEFARCLSATLKYWGGTGIGFDLTTPAYRQPALENVRWRYSRVFNWWSQGPYRTPSAPESPDLIRAMVRRPVSVSYEDRTSGWGPRLEEIRSLETACVLTLLEIARNKEVASGRKPLNDFAPDPRGSLEDLPKAEALLLEWSRQAVKEDKPEGETENWRRCIALLKDLVRVRKQ